MYGKALANSTIQVRIHKSDWKGICLLKTGERGGEVLQLCAHIGKKGLKLTYVCHGDNHIFFNTYFNIYDIFTPPPPFTPGGDSNEWLCEV